MINQIVITPPSDNFPRRGHVTYCETDGQLLELPFEIKAVKLKRTPEEKAEHRRIYRQEYVNRPHVREKIKAKLSDPITQQKRKEYGMKEEVKMRKKVLAARTRALKRELKNQNPELYHDLMARVATQNLPDPNHYTHRDAQVSMTQEELYKEAMSFPEANLNGSDPGKQ